MRVHVAYVAPGVERLVAVDVAAGATVADAVRASGIAVSGDVPPDRVYAIFGQRADADTPLRDGDRVDITRPLVCDPKRVRRERAARRARESSPAPPAAATGGRRR